MNAKIYRDGDRIIVSFEGIEDAEDFLQRVINLVSDSSVELMTPVEVPNLEPPIDAEDDFEYLQTEDSSVSADETQEEEPEIEDFGEPFTGKTPAEVMDAPNFEGFYYLFKELRSNSIPTRYKEDCIGLIANFIDKKRVLKPPYGDIDRMKKYLKMAQSMLGKEQLSDSVLDAPKNAGDYDTLCKATAQTIEKIRLSLDS